MSGVFLVVNLMIAIAIMIVLILVPKFNPALSLVIASIYMGVTCGLGFVNSIETIGTGFGNMMAGIGLPIGFGVILGQLMSDTGAAKVIARTIVHAVPNKYVLYAVAVAGFILAIPVFFDVTFWSSCCKRGEQTTCICRRSFNNRRWNCTNTCTSNT